MGLVGREARGSGWYDQAATLNLFRNQTRCSAHNTARRIISFREVALDAPASGVHGNGLQKNLALVADEPQPLGLPWVP